VIDDLRAAAATLGALIAAAVVLLAGVLCAAVYVPLRTIGQLAVRGLDEALTVIRP
jgi:hypothetical protein